MSPRPRKTRKPEKPDATLVITLFNGARQRFIPSEPILFRIFDGNRKQIYCKENTVGFVNRQVPFHDVPYADSYTVIASGKDHHQVGFYPVVINPNQPKSIDLMLVRKGCDYDFSASTWQDVSRTLPFLTNGVSSQEASNRFDDLVKDKTKNDSLAALLNITAAMNQIHLQRNTPLDYLKQIKWGDSMAQDRFFAYCDANLIEQVRAAADRKMFEAEIGSGFFHSGATNSWKQTEFGEANVQLTFHENDKKKIDGVDCVCVEPDIDYFQDKGAHTLLEVIPNAMTKHKTNPKMVYALRWMAGRREGISEFKPLYCLK